MATFRQEQIDDILNYDRAMNRIVLDNEIGQATRFNDERNPPTNRDIKFEALIGTLVDDVKAKIAEALTSIASKQFPKTDATKVTTLLGLPTGEYGANFKDMNYAAAKKAQDQQSDANYAAAKVREAELKNSALPEFQDEDEQEEDYDAAVVTDNAVPVPRNLLTATAPEFIPKNTLTASGRKRKFILRGGDEGTTDGLSKEKSQATATNATENILYDIVTKYNGIVDKLLQATQPDGRFASKRTVSSSSIGYLADVLKGLNEPLKHLVFELSQVHNPNLASVMNMMTSMVDIIDTSPPFQKVNVVAYKSGMPDFQGLSSSVQLLDVEGYVADLKSYRSKLAEMYSRLLQQSASMMFNIGDERLRQSLQSTIDEKVQQYRKVIDDIGTEIKEVRARKNITDEFEANGELIKAAQGIYENMEDLIERGEPERQEAIEKDINKSSKLFRLPGEAYDKFLMRLNQAKAEGLEALKYLTQWKIEHNLEDGDDEEVDDAINKYHRTVGEIDDDIKTYEDAMKFNTINKQGPQAVPETRRVRTRRQTRKGMEQEEESSQALQQAYVKEDEAAARAKAKKAKQEEAAAKRATEKIKRDAEAKRQAEIGLANRKAAAEKIINEINAVEAHSDLKALVKKYSDKGQISMLKKKDTAIKQELIDIIRENYKIVGKGMPEPEGGSGGLADYLSTEKKPQYWHHRELTDDDKAYKELTKSNQNWQAISNPPHTTPVGSLYPFYKKEKAALYSFPLKLKHDLAKIRPDDTQKDARGADISLLQGPIGESNREPDAPPTRKPTVTHRTAAQATQNIIQGKGEPAMERAVGSGKKNPKALHKIIFDDESNDMFGEGEACGEGGMIPEESEEEEDRFRNKKLGPKKKKSVKK